MQGDHLVAEKKCPQNRAKRKRARNSNNEYYNSHLNRKPPKDFIDYICNCKNKCNTIVSLQTRINFTQKYWSLGSYNAQTTFLGAFVKEVRHENSHEKKAVYEEI